jgi:hypothetical protein
MSRRVGVVYARDERANGPVTGGVIWASGVESGSSGGYLLERRGGGLYLTLRPLNLMTRLRGAVAAMWSSSMKIERSMRTP